MLGTHILTHTLFDWLKFTWDSQNLYGTHMIWWDSCEFYQIKENVLKNVC
jgi:hypothetical protein